MTRIVTSSSPPSPTAEGPPATPLPPPSPTQGAPGPAAAIIGSRAHGAVLFARQCASCHGPEGKGSVPNPGSQDGTVPALSPIDRTLFSRDPRVFAENIDRVIQYGSVPAGAHAALHMPAFGRTLTQAEIADIEAYVLSVNAIDRAQLTSPGIAPRHFFLLLVIVFGVAGLYLGRLGYRARTRWRERRPS